MKTYLETVEFIAEQCLETYLGGGEPTFAGIDIVAFVYGRNIEKVETDLTKAYDRLKDWHYAAMTKLNN